MKNNQMNYEMNEENIYQNRRNTLTTYEVKKIVHEINKLSYPSKTLKIDPEFKNILPALPDNKYQALKNDIKISGCLNPIITWNDTIIDGHHRYKICSDLGISFNVESKEFDNRSEAKLWIVKNLIDRRSISLYEKILLFLPMVSYLSKKAKKNQGFNQYSGKSSYKIQVDVEIGKLAGASNVTVSQVFKIEKLASQQDKEDLRSGKISIVALFRKIRSKELAFKNIKYININNETSWSIRELFRLSKKLLLRYDLNKYETNKVKETFNNFEIVLYNNREQGEI